MSRLNVLLLENIHAVAEAGFQAAGHTVRRVNGAWQLDPNASVTNIWSMFGLGASQFAIGEQGLILAYP